MISKIHSLYRKFKAFLFSLLVKRSPARPLIEAEMGRWAALNGIALVGGDLTENLQRMLYKDHLTEYRNMLYYRIGNVSGLTDKVLLRLSKWFFKPLETLTLNCPFIGPGVVIKHGFGSVIDAEKVGKGCIIFHDTYIGFKEMRGGRPVLGDYVHISCGARVMGPITIGDHSVIAANAVVTRDMLPNSLALGIPARIIEGAGNKAEYIAEGIIPAEQPQTEPELKAAEAGVPDAA